MYASFIIASTIALASSVAAWEPTLRGGQCPYDGWQHCQDQGSWGCVQLAGPNCVDQTQNCDSACGEPGRVVYAYQKDRSDDRTCVCSYEDASQPQNSNWWKTFKA